MTDFTCDLGADGVAVITWDVPGKSMNVMSLEGFAQLSALVDGCLADPACKGIVLTSGKKDFAGGMDLNVIAKMREGGAEAIFAGVMQMHAVLRKIERAGMDPKTLKGGKPIACVLPGTALGIGLELPLSCHRIFAAENPKAKIGLPEIMVGIFPGAGGTTRLVRKMGAMMAAPFLLEGKLSDPKAAKAAGIIDEVSADPMAAARDWVLNATEADLVKPWDAKGYKMPGGAPYHPAGFMTYVGASAMVSAKTMGVYPAAKALLSAVYEGALVPFDQALRIEARWFTKVLMNPSSTAMIRSLFINKEALEKGANRPKVADQSVKKLGVLGAGMMGAGIAYVSANAGIEVVLIDASQEAAERGKAYATGILDKGIQRRKVTEAKKAEVLGRITATTDYAALAGCDLVVEAVFEDPAVKAEVTAKAEAVIPETAIFATNTSTLPISGLAKASQRPAHFIGIHFFSPVDKMNLVEIIKGKDTGEVAVAKALDFVRAIRKTPIVVNDARFFYANRCIIPYINEGIRMVAEGVNPVLIENAAKLVGMPLGPLQLVDETSIDLGVKIAKATKAAMGEAYPDGAVDAVVFWMAEQGRLGKKADAGFYTYDAGKRGGMWEGLAAQYPRAAAQPELSHVQHRLLMVQVLEAVRAFEQGVLTDIREGDVGAILGWGFAPWSGGPFAWLDILGAARAVEICDALSARYGARFETPALLRDIAAKGDSFHARFGGGAAAKAA
ncbi:3-hydroxyacyl-CoA dehydrogenase NAD-binding domain-containing protein [Rhodobacter capsulatus]|jgi:3-hydroxyacyl-CoA dehydrogenase/enoyl-CoA hydratase/3-hydroxybutyryl-CoA epimerase|uniref:Fatty acid oxidation complex, alpha subunit n=1 Tax=Rhodobacter capsulatus (strain ATCC BAA-309 / NBRC 16581 / SB1003) TaxID=272942 RepID=D5AMZ6_RHOCB|nr:3-hydroxyacyl-CoA dehydrogenase NAD-binding domain-containing protein [Rhodobacter capsulatus]ADE84285.1 fatty acid oxidation complex, alpha subunit [Rhodobacter capsulatus SB 1003]ETD03019.1 3-hydroxyacyl-CoA dehydrogenase [Rhodobacter capsulatus DE442]ETD79648.1 3-hydroxyacyl-CoA dehydrogenase [Rhodobacter capsulatus R121]ETE55078.1 3-hydroxyacyl-CoA dehydrogenase [Rhodobacter capsulatus Y262]MDS0925969.1 3-hydroxyacyl-CoA dehydrogenase NAD-binding domain-containing protein [Rhodobacter c